MAAAHFGGFFLFAALVLLIFASISAPVWTSVNFLYANFPDSRLVAGNWGVCVREGLGSYDCTPSRLGYRLDQVLATLPSSDRVANTFSRGLTYSLILNPIAAGITLIALLFAVCSNVVSHILGSIVSFFAFLVTIVALALDLATFLIARNRINDAFDGKPAQLGNAMWLVVAACVCQLIASFTVCFGGLHNRRKNSAYAAGPAMTENQTFGRRRFWQRRNRGVAAY